MHGHRIARRCEPSWERSRGAVPEQLADLGWLETNPGDIDVRCLLDLGYHSAILSSDITPSRRERLLQQLGPLLAAARGYDLVLLQASPETSDQPG